MKLNLPIELPVYFNTEYTAEADRLGLNIEIDDCAVRRVMFVQLEHFHPYKTSCGKWRSKLVSGGLEYFIAMKYNELKEVLGFITGQSEG